MWARPLARAAWNDLTIRPVRISVDAARIAALIILSLLAASARPADTGDWQVILDRDGIHHAVMDIEPGTATA